MAVGAKTGKELLHLGNHPAYDEADLSSTALAAFRTAAEKKIERSVIRSLSLNVPSSI